MIPWESVGSSTTPDGTPIELHRRGDEFAILAGGQRLMGSRVRHSEVALAALGLEHLRESTDAHVLIGGLGCGFTLRAALDLLRPDAQVTVAELVPAIVLWNRGALGECAQRPLEDPRAQVVEGDVRDLLHHKGTYDAIVLDVDNGPQAFTQESNGWLYSEAGLAALASALKGGGALSLWSRNQVPAFTEQLRHAGFAATAHHVRGAARGKGERHCIWVALRS